jgi:hypothetical protein
MPSYSGITMCCFELGASAQTIVCSISGAELARRRGMPRAQRRVATRWPNITAALEWASGFSSTQHVLRQLDPASRQRVIERLCDVFRAHDRGRGVWFDARAWLVIARVR